VPLTGIPGSKVRDAKNIKSGRGCGSGASIPNILGGLTGVGAELRCAIDGIALRTFLLTWVQGRCRWATANVQNNNRRNSIAKVLGVLQRRGAVGDLSGAHIPARPQKEPTSGTVRKNKATSRREGGSDGYRGSVEAETKSPPPSRRRELA
jgi:hypothetical protein